ncbi:PucR family transcriptional regulator [Promicromonospora sp. NPDC050880]|uniref:PucR family transcriptional regulator n=1 Tax=Promicromonospora sp. NPDC050880 TaxID=3364406 RepID=UPI003788257D
MSTAMSVAAPLQVQVRDMLGWADVPLDLVGDAVGMDRHVRWAQATELIDPEPFLRGREIVLTTGLELRTPADCAHFVDSLVAADAVAIGYGIDVVTTAPPPALVHRANAAGLPVLSVPRTVPFLTFTERLAQEQTRLWVLAQDRLEAGHLFDAVRRGLADPLVLFERFVELDRPGIEFAAACWAARERLPEVAGPHRVGYVRDRTIVLGPASVVSGLVEAVDGALVLGYGGPAPRQEVRRVLAEAVAAFDVASRRGRSAGAADLATLDGLLGRLTHEQVTPFLDHVLRPIMEHDQRRSDSLLATARTFVATDGSVARTAEALFLHPNTVRKRLDRIDELTGLRVREAAGRIALQIADSGHAPILGHEQPSRPRS